MDYRIVYIGAQIVFAISFLTLLFLQRLDHRNEKFDKLEILYLLFFVTSILDGLWILVDGVPHFRVFHVLLQIVYLSTMAFTGYTWFLYTLDFFPAKSMKIGKYKLLLAIPVLIQIILIFSSLKTGFVFVVDADGMYTRGSFHMYSILMHFTYMLLGSIVALSCRKEATLHMDKRRFTAVALFPVPTFLLSAAQIALPPGLPTMQGGVLIGFLLFYGTSQNLRVTRDYLTGLPNRVTFEMEVDDHLRKYKKGVGKHIYLIEGDLDRFKHINDAMADVSSPVVGNPLSDLVGKQRQCQPLPRSSTQLHRHPGTDAGNHPGVCGAHRNFQTEADERSQGTEDAYRLELHRGVHATAAQEQRKIGIAGFL